MRWHAPVDGPVDQARYHLSLKAPGDRWLGPWAPKPSDPKPVLGMLTRRCPHFSLPNSAVVAGGGRRQFAWVIVFRIAPKVIAFLF